MARNVSRGEPFGLVLLDHMMPDMDGFSLAEAIKQDPTLVATTLMMLSSADRHDNVSRCQQVGVETYITKPIRRAELLNALLTAVNAAPSDESRATGQARHAVGHCQRSAHVLLTELDADKDRLWFDTLSGALSVNCLASSSRWIPCGVNS